MTISLANKPLLLVLEIVLWRCCKWLFESFVCLQRCLFINPSKSFVHHYQCHVDLGWKHWICRCWWIRVVQRLCWLGGMIISSVRVRIAKILWSSMLSSTYQKNSLLMLGTVSRPWKCEMFTRQASYNIKTKIFVFSLYLYIFDGLIHRSQVISELTGLWLWLKF